MITQLFGNVLRAHSAAIGGGLVTTYTSCVKCDCGAHYERAEVRLPIKDVGIFDCHNCGAVIERWHGKVAPLFRVVQLPKPKCSNAA